MSSPDSPQQRTLTLDAGGCPTENRPCRARSCRCDGTLPRRRAPAPQSTIDSRDASSGFSGSSACTAGLEVPSGGVLGLHRRGLQGDRLRCSGRRDVVPVYPEDDAGASLLRGQPARRASGTSWVTAQHRGRRGAPAAEGAVEAALKPGREASHCQRGAAATSVARGSVRSTPRPAARNPSHECGPSSSPERMRGWASRPL